MKIISVGHKNSYNGGFFVHTKHIQLLKETARKSFLFIKKERAVQKQSFYFLKFSRYFSINNNGKMGLGDILHFIHIVRFMRIYIY
ncbi:hypothetical protein CEW92_04180 [Bacillaceae bacterium SAS-127]|nr:hypothetical protein CEW92_04180 [Bacillaceae bacterium SAS-127]